jgi:hypothetical protein
MQGNWLDAKAHGLLAVAEAKPRYTRSIQLSDCAQRVYVNDHSAKTLTPEELRLYGDHR